jgi:hypothetical protein
MALVAVQSGGIPANSSKKSFFVGATLAGTLLGGLLFSYQRRRRQGQARPATKITAAPPARLPILSGPEQVEPIPPNELSGQPCAQCQNSPQHRPGPWYRLQGQIYCQDCAQDKARQAGVSLVPPLAIAASTILSPKSFRPKAYLPRRTTLKSKSITVGPLDNLEGYAVLARGQDTGLSLTPEVKVEDGGQVRINKARWFVNYDQAGKAIAGPFESVKQAQGMASLLANIDWNRRVEEIPEQDIKIAAELARIYRDELGFAKVLINRNSIE